MKTKASFLLTLLFLIPAYVSAQNSYQSSWNTHENMPWVGEELWANRMQDWEVKDKQLLCNITGKNRSVALLTHELTDPEKGFELEGIFQFLNLEDEGLVGFRLGSQGRNPDYRSAAVYGNGIRIGVTNKGELVIHDQKTVPLISKEVLFGRFTLLAKCEKVSNGVGVTLEIRKADGSSIMEVRKVFLAKDLKGGIALLADFNVKAKQILKPSIQVKSWNVKGAAFSFDAKRTYGPIYFTKYTLSEGILKMTAQCAPFDMKRLKASLYLKKGMGWFNAAESQIGALSRNAIFKVSDFDFSNKTQFKVVLEPAAGKVYSYEGTIEPEPGTDKELKLGLFSCNQDHGFPDGDLRENILKHDVDAALFLGDQFYEGFGGFGVEKTSLERSSLDYLRKWLMFGWSYRDVFRNVPMISIPDDHDVYHGNVWGEGGKKTEDDSTGYVVQDRGGYKMPAEWVTMVQESQTAHLPDPVDPTPVLQNIPVYYTSWNWGPVSFAILEDRKFKSAPKNIFPPEAKIANGFVTNSEINVDESYNGSNAELLGERQEAFLKDWGLNWSDKTYFKIVLSQTNLATVATLPAGETSDQIVPRLPTPAKGVYVSGDEPTKDMDSNGWPHAKRNVAVDLLRKGFALHLAGDQHLASVLQYGVDEHGDGGFAFAGPALNNTWPRRWWPTLDADHKPLEGQPRYTGNFLDGFKNKITVHAISNPVETNRFPKIIHNRATGYGIVKLTPVSQDIELECWPRYVEIGSPNAQQYEGWPMKLNVDDNYGRKAYATLGPLQSDIENPVVQVINTKTKEVLYTRRFIGTEVSPKVFAKGKYSVSMGISSDSLEVIYPKIKAK